ncbi:hypothetical protein ACFYRN_08610 [Streptomyces sp. NPDC005227]|uniref:hypothetical protein n=1 Tax=Streptomyces sp. NPDC005227 TaxID=3364707 RepID=UPI003680B42A
MISRQDYDPTSLAVGVLVIGGGALLLSLLFGMWAAFSVVVAMALAITVGAAVQCRRDARQERERREWRRIIWEEWGYRE